mmetsp:Transcript_5046/g.20160  ORF Transcript_5046/g.20160 Transcript_5046/m.20160 type:complete len:311 (+) Transcript_5046:2564-3496(+)|eukprot:scaffold8192_cov267-Pinguiococcus_pyrenoidosus.AAC.4
MYLFDQLHFLLLRGEHGGELLRIRLLLRVGVLHQIGHDLVRVALIDEILLPPRAVVHFARVGRNERVEECEASFRRIRLRTQDPPQPLRLLPARRSVKVYLDQDVGHGEIDAGVTDTRDEHGVYDGGGPERLQDVLALDQGRAPGDPRALQAIRVDLQADDVVAEHEELVPSPFVVVHEILTDAELVGIQGVEMPVSGRRRAAEVLAIKLLRHGAPDFDAFHVAKVAPRGQIHPVRLVQLRADQVVQVVNLAVLADQRGGEAELRVRLHVLHHAAEGLGRRLVDLVEDHEAPLAALDLLHQSRGHFRALL